MTDKRRHRSTSTALTLVELLVVITILAIVAGVVLPLAQPALKRNAVREAAREVQTFLDGARARAIATQQPVGVRFELQNIEPRGGGNPAPPPPDHTNDTAFAMSLVQMSSPANLEAIGPSPLRTASLGGVQLTYSDWDFWLREYARIPINDRRGLVQIGSNPRFFSLPKKVGNPIEPPPQNPGPQEPDAAFYYNDNTDSFLLQFGAPDGNCVDTSTTAGYLRPTVIRGTPVRLFFEPIRPRFSVGGRVELPVGTYVDISWSGVGLNGKFFDDGVTGLTLVFGPSGQVEWLYGHVDFPFEESWALPWRDEPNDPRFRTQFDKRFVLSGNPNAGTRPFRKQDRCGPYVPEAPIHFLIGRQKRSANAEPYLNLRPESGSLWVSVNHRTGVISTSDNLGSSRQVIFSNQINDEELIKLVIESRESVNVALDAGG